MSETIIATVSMQAFYDKQRNVANILALLARAVDAGAGLVVFPEQILQGYLTDTLRLDFDNVAWQFANAEVIETGEGIGRIRQAVIQHQVYAVVGMTERHPRFPEVLFNTVVLLGPEGEVGRYRKVHQPGDEKHVYYPGDRFPVFDTPLGRIGMLICYDKVFPESTRELALRGADIMIMPTAWGLAGDSRDPEQDSMVDSYTLFGRVRAMENQCWMVESNMHGAHGNLLYHGHSRIIDPRGNIIADTGNAAGIAMASVNIRDAITHSRSVGYMGYFFLKDYVPVRVSDPVLTVRHHPAQHGGE
ncbi:carbon-nitrogen hydrolase family protein [Acerihabitans arboris]|uniref:Carbon-nitrogen hydrolase family protein n=1 Tax=Acerihabitans arboris TaxID=2691583 RepID=A0A845SED4_9GAMM|nr:carbon-nitrogen hydrolase family protein [Acerihabitans arboris]NDL61737.1 carbon-nitrogen hydrolase family protein [Acerihabitans arboris]